MKAAEGAGYWAAGPADHSAGPNWLCKTCMENALSPLCRIHRVSGTEPAQSPAEGTMEPEVALTLKEVRNLVEETEVLKE